MIDRVGRSLLLVMGVLLVGGCGKEPKTDGILNVSDHPYITDLPHPVDFTLVERQSEDRVTQGNRSAKHVYRGKHDLQTVKAFYQHHMPLSNWEAVQHSLSKGVYLLRYRKGREQCEIRVERMPSGFFGAVTQVRLTIQPTILEMPGRRQGETPVEQP